MLAKGLLRTGFAALFIFSTAAIYAADDTKKATDAPKTETKSETATPSRAGKLIKPYSDLKDLSAEQTAKIKEIHAKALADEKEIKAKEKEACMALLSDDQKKELAEAGAKAAADKKTATAEKKTEKTAAASESK